MALGLQTAKKARITDAAWSAVKGLGINRPVRGTRAGKSVQRKKTMITNALVTSNGGVSTRPAAISTHQGRDDNISLPTPASAFSPLLASHKTSITDHGNSASATTYKPATHFALIN